MPFKNNKPYERWDVRKAKESAAGEHLAYSASPTAQSPSFTAKLSTPSICAQCGTSIPEGRSFCSQSCIAKWRVVRNQQWENAMAKRMEEKGWKLFHPSVCCDRIGVKEGRVFFIEFKPRGKAELRDYQRMVRDLAPHMYRVVIGKFDPEKLGTLGITGEGIRPKGARRRRPKPMYSSNSSRFRGVNFDKQAQMWRARFYMNGKRISLGWFRTEEDAARAYDDELERMLGIRVNFV